MLGACLELGICEGDPGNLEICKAKKLESGGSWASQGLCRKQAPLRCAWEVEHTFGAQEIKTRESFMCSH